MTNAVAEMETELTFSPSGKDNELPLMGDTCGVVEGVDKMLSRAVHCLVLTWEGDVEQLFTNTKPEELNSSWFTPNDKGTLSVYGVDKKGMVIFGMARYEGHLNSENKIEQSDHYFIKRMSKTNRFE
jgi:hypothetical protein